MLTHISRRCCLLATAISLCFNRCCCHAPTFLSHCYLFSTQTIEEVFHSFHPLSLSPSVPFSSLFFFVVIIPFFLCFEVVVVVVVVAAFFAVCSSSCCIPLSTAMRFLSWHSHSQCIALNCMPCVPPKDEKHADNLNIAFHLVNTQNFRTHPIDHQPSTQIQCAGFRLLSFPLCQHTHTIQRSNVKMESRENWRERREIREKRK